MPSPPTADADQETDDEASSLRSRSDDRRARVVREDALASMANDLVTLSAARLLRLDLPETLLDAVHAAQAIKSYSAKNRQMRAVRAELRDAEWWIIRGKLDSLIETGVVAQTSGDGRESEWAVRLIGEGNEALEELLREHPTADRAHLRTLVRNVIRATDNRRKKAELQLAQALRSVLRS